MQMSTTSYMYVRKNAKINVRHKIHCIRKNNAKTPYLAADIYFLRTYLDLVADTTGPNITRALL